MIISIDPEILSRMSQLAAQAVGDIEKSVSTSKKIIEHSDWNCQERDTITEATGSIKNRLVRLEEHLQSFSSRLETISQNFVEMKNGWQSSMANVDSAVSSQISMPIETQTGSNCLLLSDTVKSFTEVNMGDSLSCYEASSITDPIKICEFPNLRLGTR